MICVKASQRPAVKWIPSGFQKCSFACSCFLRCPWQAQSGQSQPGNDYSKAWGPAGAVYPSQWYFHPLIQPGTWQWPVRLSTPQNPPVLLIPTPMSLLSLSPPSHLVFALNISEVRRFLFPPTPASHFKLRNKTRHKAGKASGNQPPLPAHASPRTSVPPWLWVCTDWALYFGYPAPQFSSIILTFSHSLRTRSSCSI